MPWCPRCGYEYRDDVKLCTDCGSELVSENPVPAYMKSSTQVLELAAVCVLVPWLGFAVLALLGNVINLASPQQAKDVTGSLLLALAGILILALSGMYGYLRRLRVLVITIFEAWVSGGFTQFLIFFILVVLGQVPEPYKLIIAYPLSMICSLLALIAVKIGGYVGLHWRRLSAS